MKRISIVWIAFILSLTLLVACKNNNVNNSKEGLKEATTEVVSEGEKKKIICTIFPIYDWVREIIGDNISSFDLTCLIDNGVDLHNFNPTAADIIDIQNCDMFIYVGGESDAWVSDVFDKVVEKNVIRINLLELMGDKAKIEEIKEGMEHEHEEEEIEDGEHHEEGEHEEEFDEHIWLSLKNAKYLCNVIKNNIIELDNANKNQYEANYNKYSELLNDLDNRFAKAADLDGGAVMLFGDRFPFRYLFDDYGINYYAAFSGCSAESEASFKTIIFLANKVDELKLKHVLRIEGSNDKIAKTIIENTKSKDQDIIIMNSMQGVSLNEIKNGATYIGIMKENLNAFEKALK